LTVSLTYSIIPKGGLKKEMKTLRKIRKDAKALSPVVASIILIAVTVAVSIAVAAWMGALSIGFMETEQMSVTNAQFGAADITMSLQNTGTTDITLVQATVNGVDYTISGAVNANSPGSVTIAGVNPQPGFTYTIKLLSAKGTWFPYTAVAP